MLCAWGLYARGSEIESRRLPFFFLLSFFFLFPFSSCLMFEACFSLLFFSNPRKFPSHEPNTTIQDGGAPRVGLRPLGATDSAQTSYPPFAPPDESIPAECACVRARVGYCAGLWGAYLSSSGFLLPGKSFSRQKKIRLSDWSRAVTWAKYGSLIGYWIK